MILRNQEVIDGNIKPFELMKKLGMSKTTYYRYVSKVIASENANRKQQQIENEQIFNQVCVLALQKETYSKVYEFLKEEASDEE